MNSNRESINEMNNKENHGLRDVVLKNKINTSVAVTEG